jgi:hypothetical protein
MSENIVASATLARTAAVPSTARIEALRTSLAGAPQALGNPVEAERTLVDGRANYQSFVSGAVFTSPAFGTFRISHASDLKWQQTAAMTTADGTSVQDYLGAVVAPAQAAPGGGEVVYFERGAIVVRPTGSAFVTYGAIYVRYRALGGVTSFLGLPVSDEEPVGNGRRSRFDSGEITWRGDLGAHEVHGAIYARFEALGGAAAFGFPTSDETPVLQNKNELGRYNTFEGGRAIYWSGASGAWDVYGAIKSTWEAFGGATGPLGFPISGETDTPLAHATLPLNLPNNDANGRFNDFANGVIVWHPAGPYSGAFPILSLPFHVDSFNSNFDDIHVQTNVSSSYGQSYATWAPSASDYASNPRVQADVFTVPVVHSDLSISVWFDGLGDHSLGKDERLGIYASTLNISNLWGTLDAPDHGANQNQNSSYSFDVRFTTQPTLPVAPNAPFRASYYWPFHNFSTPELSWTQFAQTFTDVHDDESTVWHPFDHLFYELVFKGVAAKGNCFGMCLESVYAQFRRSDFSEPIYNNPFIAYSQALQGGADPEPSTVPDDARFTNPINLRHGYQVGSDMINYFLDMFLTGRTHDPIKAFLESKASFDAGDLPVMSMSEDYFFGGGHVVRPYEWHQDTNPWTIKVANPNAPYARNPNDNAPLSVISIDPHANTFSFQEGWADDKNTVPTIYSGGEFSGGRLFSIPYSVVSGPPHSCFWEVVALLAAGTLIILGDDGTTAQVTDEAGHTYFTQPALSPAVESREPAPRGAENSVGALAGTPVLHSVKTIDENPATRIPNFGPVPILSRTPSDALVRGTADRANFVGLLRETPVGEAFYLRRPPEIPKRSTPAAAASSAANTQPHAGVTTIDLARETSVLAHADPLNDHATPSIEHAVACPKGGSYRWGLRSPIMSLVAQVTGSQGDTDAIHVDWPGRPGQAITLRAGGSAKTASVQIVGPLAAGPALAKIFQIDSLPMTVEQPITLRLDNGGADLLIDNPGPQITLGLRFQSGPLATNVAQRPSVVIESGKTHRFTPTDWTAAKVASAPITLQVLELGGTTVVKESLI